MGRSNKFSLTIKSHSSTRVNPYDKITLNALNVNCPDKQIILPKLDNHGLQHVYIELFSLLVFVVALGTQYLNLYRSVWLLSKTRSGQPTNYHLIDLDVSQFSLIFIGQSSLISILTALSNKVTAPNIMKLIARNQSPQHISSSKQQTTRQQSQSSSFSSPATTPLLTNNNSNNYSPETINQSSYKPHQHQTLTNQPQQHQNITSTPNHQYNINSLTTIITATASWICNYYLFKCAYRIWDNFGLNGLSFISYPILVSIFFNSTHIIQVVEGCCKTRRFNLSFLTLSMTLFSYHIKFDDQKLCHNCSNQPDDIRDEVERFRTIFNERIKFVLVKSLLMAYYSSFVPICFAPSFIYYDFAWSAQHVVITWISSLIMLLSSSYTPHFYDALHRSAYHFGKWQKLESRNTLVPCINWSESVIYPQGVVVKHYRGYFRSESVSNCAQPGVSSHLCYYIVFSNPKMGFVAILAMLSLLLVCQMYLLLASTEWYKLVAMTNMMLMNIYSIFRLVKSLVIITKIYKEKH